MGAESGYFPSGKSVLRRVHGARVVGVLYGQRALLMQATNPLAFAGLMANTAGLDAPFRRLVHTAKTMEIVFFGAQADANREAARVRGLHARVRGEIEQPAGSFSAGSAYRADDPRLLLWILACLADSAQAAYETFVRRLGAVERERFWRDYLLVGELFGLPPSEAPASYADYRDYVEHRLASDELYVVREAREIGRTVAFDMPVPLHRLPALQVINLCVLGLLPERVRRLYGLSFGRPQRLAFEAVARASRAAAPITPARIRRGSSAGDYDLVASTERRRLADAA